ncbi:TonB-dependent receptor [uncultured Aquimonas sp.]|uniref:TonB-dependent receptor n=1 Tax=uncultured Aquimonas sp. TaxID=385483 RepID=UPI00086C6166|nr:TonB-dependent receptor [uncultured Aquimonas sp.]ODU48330.1 MAG: TonB-dependent receptor [Xanthomonadaceae bacterium SCN 69-123]
MPRTLRPAALSLALAAALPAFAQDASTSPAQLDAITVTAQRRAEDPQKIPLAITTVSAEKLDILGSGGEDIRFLSGRLPSLNIESSFGRAFPRFYIRGLGNGDFDLNASQPVSLIYDEVVLENPLLKGFPVFDLDRLELLRGPQGSLFGRNTPAGVLKFESVQPAQERSGYGQFAYGRFDTVNTEGAIGGGLSEAWSARVSGLYQRRGDWVDNAFTGRSDQYEGYREFAGRAQFLYEPNDSSRALFNVHLRDLDGTARLFRANVFKPGSNDLVDGFRRSVVAIDGDNRSTLRNVGGSARLAFDLDRVTLYSVTGYESVDSYSRGDIDGGFGASYAPPFGPGFIPFDAQSADGLPDHRQLTQEFRLASNEWGAFDWQAGLFLFDEDITIDSFNFNTFSGAQNGYAVQEQRNKAYALFTSGEYDVSDSLRLAGGLRFTRDEKDFSAQRLVSPIGGGATGVLTANPSDSNVSGDLSASWFIDSDRTVYARYARGFRAPSIQGRLLFGDSISVADSETVDSIELGFKSNLWDGRARFNIAAFAYEVKDQQLTAVGGTTNFNTLINADKSIGRGVEVDLDAYVTDNLLLTFGYSHNKTEIRDRGLAIAPCGGGCTVLDPAGATAGTVSIYGNPLPQAPKNVANVTARYSIPVGEDEIFIYTDWAYRSEINFFLYEAAEFRGKALLEGGLRAGYSWNYGKHELALFGRNITDKLVAVGGIDFNNLTGFVNEPRVWGVEFTTTF